MVEDAIDAQCRSHYLELTLKTNPTRHPVIISHHKTPKRYEPVGTTAPLIAITSSTLGKANSIILMLLLQMKPMTRILLCVCAGLVQPTMSFNQDPLQTSEERRNHQYSPGSNTYFRSPS